MHILMATSEMAPLAKSGGLGDVLGALPKYLGRMGHQVTVVLPFYRQINAHQHGIDLEGDWFEARVGGERFFGGLHQWTPHPGVTVYLVAQDQFYARDGIYGDRFGAYGDNHRRFIFLCRATLEVARRLAREGNAPDLFHGHDWHTGLIPAYIQEGQLGWSLPSVFSIHNLQYQGRYGYDLLWEAGLNGVFARHDLELWGSLSFMKAGLVFSDILSTVSQGYAREIQTSEFGGGLEGLLRSRRHELFGIVNGIDMEEWNPAADPHIAARFHPGRMNGKAICKAALQKEFGLPERAEVPLFAVISRLVGQKGIELLGSILPHLLTRDVQLVVLGSGESQYQEMFRHFHQQMPHKVGVHIGFNVPMSHRIEAGADLFLMPSVFEPCGLNQLYSLRYGTLPIVRAVGGLNDTVQHLDLARESGNGFKFQHYDAQGLRWAIREALEAYGQRESWSRVREAVMWQDFSWQSAAQKYVHLYKRALSQ